MKIRGTQGNTRGTKKHDGKTTGKTKRWPQKDRVKWKNMAYKKKIRGSHDLDKINPGATQGKNKIKLRERQEGH